MRGIERICTLLIVAGIAATGYTQPKPDKAKATTQPSRNDSKASSLRAHGIGTSEAELIAFLENGFPQPIPSGKMPAKPVEKSQLAIDAIAKLAELQSKQAIPMLAGMASLSFPRGVHEVVAIDLQNTAPDSQESFRTKAAQLLQYNAVTALAAIGDSSSLEITRQVFAAEANIAPRIQYAICMAMLGDGSGIDYLVQVIQQENRRESAAAARAFYIITGQDFGYTEHTSARGRKVKAKQYRSWWSANRSSFTVDPNAVRERRADPNAMKPFQARSTRDLLKLASFYFDFKNEWKSKDAREQLAVAGTSLNGDLEKIGADVMEDLDVRLEALNWYYEANRSAAKPFLRKLRRDENPEIVDKVNTLISQIEEDEAGPIELQQKK